MKYAIDITSPKLKVTPHPTLSMPLLLFFPLYSLLKFFAGPLIGPLPPLPTGGGIQVANEKWDFVAGIA
jgi:hypothetical protein